MNLFRKKPKRKHKKQPTALAKRQAAKWTPPFQQKTIRFTNDISEKKADEPPIYMPPTTINDSSSFEEDATKDKETTKKKVVYKEQSAKKAFMETFKKLSNGRWRSWDIWVDFVTMAACSLSNVVDKSHYDEREALYMKIISKYSKEEQQLFPELFAHTVMALDENPEQDFLGQVYTELGLNSKEHQQIFTPYNISHMMASMIIGDIVSQVKENGYVSIFDCCCGAGSTLIAAINVSKEKLAKADMNFQNHILVVGQDIDCVVAMMCYIQVSLLDVAGYFKVGNALTEPMEASDNTENYWFTPMYFMPVWEYRRIFNSFDKMLNGENNNDRDKKTTSE